MTMSSCDFRVIVALPLLFAMTSTLQAQSTKAELFGIIRDPSGLPVNAARVELTNAGTDAKSAVETDLNGGYHFFALTAGAYRLAATKRGFTALRREGIVVRVGDQLNLDLQLQVGDVSQSILVTAGAPLLQTTRGTATFVVEQKKVVALPLD